MLLRSHYDQEITCVAAYVREESAQQPGAAATARCDNPALTWGAANKTADASITIVRVMSQQSRSDPPSEPGRVSG